MKEYSKDAGAVMRSIRRRRKITLAKAAPRFSMSISALSRRERGIEAIQRSEVEQAILIYELDLWEAHELRQAAGFLPSTQNPMPNQAAWQTYAEFILLNTPYPVWFVNRGGYILAWNTPMALLWSLQQKSESGSLHLFDVIIFSQRSKELLQGAWRESVLTIFSYYYHSTLAISNDPTVQTTLHRYRRQYGEQFTELWREAQSEDVRLGNQVTEIGQAIGTFHTEAGMLRLLYLKSAAPYSDQQNLYLYLPIGEASRKTYRQFCGGAQSGAYFS